MEQVGIGTLLTYRGAVTQAKRVLPTTTNVIGIAGAHLGTTVVVLIVTDCEAIVVERDGTIAWSGPMARMRAKMWQMGVELVPAAGPPQRLRMAITTRMRVAGLINSRAAIAPNRSSELTVSVVYARGTDLKPGLRVGLDLAQDGVTISSVSSGQVLLEAHGATLRDFTVGGPGVVNEGGGFIGGGFGIDAAVKGIAAATVLNNMTSSTRIQTFIRVAADSWTVGLISNELTTDEVIARAPVIMASVATPSAAASSSLVQELQGLAVLHSEGVLSDEEFATAKAMMLHA